MHKFRSKMKDEELDFTSICLLYDPSQLWIV